MNWINLVEDMDSWRASESAVMHSIRVTKTAGSVCSSSGTTGFSRRTLFRGVRYH